MEKYANYGFRRWGQNNRYCDQRFSAPDGSGKNNVAALRIRSRNPAIAFPDGGIRSSSDCDWQPDAYGWKEQPSGRKSHEIWPQTVSILGLTGRVLGRTAYQCCRRRTP